MFPETCRNHALGTCFTLDKVKNHVVKVFQPLFEAPEGGLDIEHWSLDHRICSATPLCSCAMENRPVSDEVADRSIKLEVSLPSGRCETVVVSQVGTVADLKLAAQRSFGQGFLRLIARDGRLLEPKYPLPLSGRARWRQPHCCCIAAKDSCNQECVCLVVSGRW